MSEPQQKPQEREKVRWVLWEHGEIVALRLAPADHPPGEKWENIGPPEDRK